jgi:hypothetical protein
MNPITTNLEHAIFKEVVETEKHLHNNEKWFGLAGTPAAETHRADRITLLPDPFQVDAGNDTWGSWLQILGSSDTPVATGKTKFDLHRILVVAHETNNQDYFLQLVSGESAGIAAKLTAEDFTEMGLTTGGGISQVGPLDLLDVRVTAGQKVWVRIWADGQNTSTLSFYFGLHEYDV